ncbi:signal peptidase I [candidate division WWE3 bacterium]|nr:signal peptidase I [candidate division WWE3 bacterium]
MTETFAITLAVALAINSFLAFPEIVIGGSMEPTLYTGERLLVERISPRFGKLKRGDIIIFNPPGRSIDYVKRIVGLPGESIEVLNCETYLIDENGGKAKLRESYVSESCEGNPEPVRVKIPSDAYYVMGDNRAKSFDSRQFGFLQKSRIAGKVFLRFWPPSALKHFS